MRALVLHPSRIAFACSIMALAQRAGAQDSEVTATALFNEGRRLMAAHHDAQACPKFAESQRLSPSGGTLINLAECYEHTGQTASAWAAWSAAAARANAAGKASAEKSAMARAVALEPTLSKLTIDVDPRSDVPGLEVKRDGVPIGHDEFGLPLPVDPGTHTVEAKAPARRPWSSEVRVAAREADARVTVSLPDAPESPAVAVTSTITGADSRSVAEAPAPAPPLAETPLSGSGWTGQNTAALIVGGAGFVGIALGSVFGLEAKSKNDEALQSANCPTSKACNPSGLQLTSDARTAATIATVSFVAGGAALAGGLLLWVTAPRAPRTAGVGRIMPVFGRSGAGVEVKGAW